MSLRAFVFALIPAALFAQMTPQQRVFDLQSLVNVYVKGYGPYEWKRDRFGVDLYKANPWQDRVTKAKDDLEAIEAMSEYVASLRDSHSGLFLTTNYVAYLNIDVDLFDGKVLIENIVRSRLPVSAFPAQIGDEIVAVDGKTAEEWISYFQRFSGNAEDRSWRRLAADAITYRPQEVYPRAHEHGPTASVQVLHQDGRVATYDVPWRVTGVPFTQAGPIPSPRSVTPRTAVSDAAPVPTPQPGTWAANLPKLRALSRRHVTRNTRLTGFGSNLPIYSLPPGFQVRLGRRAADFHFTGTYQSGNKRLGLIRIPHFEPTDEFSATSELFNEIAFLKANTDGLVVDITRNPGGGCYGTTVLQALIPYNYRLPTDLIRPTLTDLAGWEQELESARAAGADTDVALLEKIVNEYRTALAANRGLTGPIPFCNDTDLWTPLRDNRFNTFAYDKPIVLLVDEMSFSFADTVAATLQDSGRATVFGYRTNGAGGSVGDTRAGLYSETTVSLSLTLGIRPRSVFTTEYGDSNVLENAGVRPDAYYDAQTAENLIKGYRPFVTAFTNVLLDAIGR